jgi:hypothetical protein
MFLLLTVTQLCLPSSVWFLNPVYRQNVPVGLSVQDKMNMPRDACSQCVSDRLEICECSSHFNRHNPDVISSKHALFYTYFMLLLGIEPQILGRPARGLVAIVQSV